MNHGWVTFWGYPTFWEGVTRKYFFYNLACARAETLFQDFGFMLVNRQKYLKLAVFRLFILKLYCTYVCHFKNSSVYTADHSMQSLHYRTT